MLFIVAEKDCVSGMANRDYYEVLGIDKNATEADIKEHTGEWPANTIRI